MLPPFRGIVASVVVLAGAAAGCDTLAPGLPADTDVLDGPIEDLSPTQLARHTAGDEEFARRFTPADGVGPMFVAMSCEQCHVGDGKAHPLFTITRFGRGSGGTFDPLTELGGPQLQNRAIPGYPAEVIPAEADGVSGFLAPAVTGLGYLEAVDDADLVALADPDDADSDGVSGRLSLVPARGAAAEAVRRDLAFQGPGGPRGTVVDGAYHIGRFGKKASAVNLLHQTATAYLQDMGLTTDLLPEDLTNVQVGALGGDDVTDPEIGSGILDAVAFYLQTLRVPPRREPDAPQVVEGGRVFTEIGCADCHVPTLRTGRHEIARLDRVEFHPFTDLLLHDMGPDLDDGYAEGGSMTSEWRTAPLWGLGLAQETQGGEAFYLHDGRARTIEEAIGYHGGEGSRSRAAFEALAPAQREALLAYLRSL